MASIIVLSYRIPGGQRVRIIGHNKSRGNDFAIHEDVVRDPGSWHSIVDKILERMKTYKQVDRFLYVAPGALVRPPLPELDRSGWDVAAHVESIGTRPEAPGPFSGIGKVKTSTLAFMRTIRTMRLLERWAGRAETQPAVDPAVSLAISLAEIQDVRFLHLPIEYAWVESEHRPLHRSMTSLVEHGFVLPVTHVPAVSGEKVVVATSPDPTSQNPSLFVRPPEVLWNGHLYSYASYGKINREILLRVANSVVVRLDTTNAEPVLVDEYTRSRIDAYKSTLVGERAPFLRFFGPDFRPVRKGEKICWTMMETAGRVHADMAKQVNESYDQLWAPTAWNAETFRAGGVKVPISVVPLGVDPLIYKPGKRMKLPLCRLVSTGKRGLVASPSGFVFLSVGLISPRKGFDVVADALEGTFPRRADIDLVLATTHAPSGWELWLRENFYKRKIRVWMLEGRFAEHEMARIYLGADAYVSASLGEGWNLTAQEAAAVGLPVVVPRNSAHPDVFGDAAFMFDPDGTAPCPEVAPVSPWYVGMEFSKFGSKSKKELGEILKAVHRGGPGILERTQQVRKRATSMTWDVAAAQVVQRLIDVQP